MSRFAGALAVCAVLLAPQSFAQGTDEVEVGRAVAQAERKMVVAKNMELSEEESSAFWPVYNDFHEALRKVNDRRVALIQQFAKDYETFSDEAAEQLVADYFDIQQERLKIRKSWVKRFNKVLPPRKVARYVQVENKLDAIVNFELARSIPLVQ